MKIDTIVVLVLTSIALASVIWAEMRSRANSKPPVAKAAETAFPSTQADIEQQRRS